MEKHQSGVRPLEAEITISSHNYSSWCLRGWLLLCMSGLPFREVQLAGDDVTARAELLQQTSSIRIPTMSHGGILLWDVLAMAEYLHEICPEAQLYPADIAARAHCRSVCGEMHGGFTTLRAALPVNLRAFRPNFPIWSGVRADITRITDIWRDCLATYGGPFLFGGRLSVADAMFAPVCTRFVTYDVDLDAPCAGYRDRIMALPQMREWIKAADNEPELVAELEVEGEF